MGKQHYGREKTRKTNGTTNPKGRNINQTAEEIFKNSISIFREIWEDMPCMKQEQVAIKKKQSENKRHWELKNMTEK